ncbi:uroporphyrinogen-III C-methyltransferase [Haladaptatus halobius]|uniref:uroporphyrinogen-III C-methyltransferase n=1 Tax=Haladaptatus halobius TaxID=2884875 RepID=UPI001D0ADBAD|nr:uroporphyrinogen-III C-methyltransferase [Haladaptatus halobius]
MSEDTIERAQSDPERTDRIKDSSVPIQIPLAKERDTTSQQTSVQEQETRNVLSDIVERSKREEQFSPDVAESDNRDRSVKRINEKGETGTVFLVGSGPGDPELLTRRAWRLLRESDVVLHDSLTGDEIVDQLPESVEVIDVGKRSPQRTTQDEINELMLERSQKEEAVVRLKGGDPNVFGRGGEEAEYLASEDIPFEIVPGVSSVLAVPSVSGIPLTHRDRSSSLTIITGHQTPDKDESAIDWSAIADSVTGGGTLVILMGVNRLPNNVRALRKHGVPRGTPAAMVQKATWSDEKTVTGTLGNIVGKSREAAIESPAVTIVGDVVTVRGNVKEWLLR